ncbi:tRNA (N(6)-L-threonylcarbamoyladenosine(37)-C(2))-methylthiotransferase [Methanotorris formicicus]|nr:tRNA (N(6)-L-threonylcarbamoyladenosine(37)-C(2))-methylthiotransferase [Methanotorris formicicus]
MKIYVEGYGCTLNIADTNIIENSLKEFNFEITDNVEDADLVIINTCVVRLETENRMFARINYFKSLDKKVVVAGCLAKALKKKVENLADLLIMPREAHLSGEIIHEHFVEKNKKENTINLEEKLKYISPSLITPLPICEGCIGECSYCIVKVARGRLISYSREKIVKKAEELINSGTKCLLITAQDTACYGFDINDNLPNLINDLCSINGEFIMRIGMMHAKNVGDILDDLIEAYKDEKVAKLLHLPLQSGDDGVLKAMKRGYTVDEFISIVNEFRKKIEDLTFVTDIIVGFPTETEEAFENTLEVLRKIKPDYIHGAKYTSRKYTEAARMKQIDTKIRKRRSEILDKLRRELSYMNNKKYVGKKMKVLITEENKGITHNFKVVRFNEDADIGAFKEIKITDAKTFGLFGNL